jgi:hypothetical protein
LRNSRGHARIEQFWFLVGRAFVTLNEDFPNLDAFQHLPQLLLHALAGTENRYADDFLRQFDPGKWQASGLVKNSDGT